MKFQVGFALWLKLLPNKISPLRSENKNHETQLSLSLVSTWFRNGKDVYNPEPYSSLVFFICSMPAHSHIPLFSMKMWLLPYSSSCSDLHFLVCSLSWTRPLLLSVNLDIVMGLRTLKGLMRYLFHYCYWKLQCLEYLHKKIKDRCYRATFYSLIGHYFLVHNPK